MFAAAMFTNAVSVYLLHDVDTDLMGKWSLAFWQLTLEFFIFSIVLTVCFFLLSWIGTMVFRLRRVPLNHGLGFALGIAVILIQYPAEFIVRKLSGHTADSFLLCYMLLSPIFCVAIVLLNAHKRQAGSHSQTTTEATLS